MIRSSSDIEINYAPLPPAAASTITATLLGNSTIQLAVSPTTATPVDQPVTLTATVGQADGQPPDGTVEFDENGTAIPGCGAENFSSFSPEYQGIATCT
ncbi:MAG: hypothetical protein ACRDL5_13970, partial [Solirubrobacteraceae bacterium]